MITCNVFDLRLTLLGTKIDPYVEYELITDLPAGTRAIVSFERTFTNMADEVCLWCGFNDAFEVIPRINGDYNGLKGKISVNESDRMGLGWFNDSTGEFSSGIKSKIGDDLCVSVTVGGRQRIKAFGKNNSELTGDMVSTSGELNIARTHKTIAVPMAEEFQPSARDE